MKRIFRVSAESNVMEIEAILLLSELRPFLIRIKRMHDNSNSRKKNVRKISVKINEIH